MSRKFVISVAQTYAQQWLSWFVFTILIALVVNAIWKVALFEIADTTLAIVLSYVIVLLCIYAYGVANCFIRGEVRLALFIAVYAIFFALLPFACVLAYRFYGWVGGFMGGHPLDNFTVSAAAAHKNFSDIVQYYLDFWAGVGHHISGAVTSVDGKILGLAMPAWMARITASENLPQWISALTAAVSLLIPRQREI